MSAELLWSGASFWTREPWFEFRYPLLTEDTQHTKMWVGGSNFLQVLNNTSRKTNLGVSGIGSKLQCEDWLYSKTASCLKQLTLVSCQGQCFAVEKGKVSACELSFHEIGIWSQSLICICLSVLFFWHFSLYIQIRFTLNTVISKLLYLH